jgi:hypothetical protein
VIAGLIFELPDQNVLSFSSACFVLVSVFFFTYTRCSVKCSAALMLHVGLILIGIISHVILLVLIGVSAALMLHNPVLRTNSFLIAT